MRIKKKGNNEMKEYIYCGGRIWSHEGVFDHMVMMNRYCPV